MSRPEVSFDHHGPEFNGDAVGVMADLRATCPVAWTEAHGGYWVVADYDSVHLVSSDAETFGSARTSFQGEGVETLIPKNPSPKPNLPIESDPPEHGNVRRLLNRLTSPAATAQMEPMIQRWTTFFIDRWIEDGACDFAYDLASPVPTSVTLEWLGLPTADWLPIATSYHDLMGTAPGSDRFQAAVHAQRNVIAPMLQEVIAKRRAAPRDDVLSHLVAQDLDGEPVDDFTVYCVAATLLAGGVDTTTALTCHALMHLDRYPEDRRRLIDDPSLLTAATEEFLRVYPPVPSSARTVRAETEVGGCTMREGDRVLFLRWSANLDEGAFPDATSFVIDRFPNRHTTFGIGPHRCAGSHLARSMFRIMVSDVLERLGDYAIVHDAAEPYSDQGAFTGWSNLPARFTPGPRRGS